MKIVALVDDKLSAQTFTQATILANSLESIGYSTAIIANNLSVAKSTAISRNDVALYNLVNQINVSLDDNGSNDAISQLRVMLERLELHEHIDYIIIPDIIYIKDLDTLHNFFNMTILTTCPPGDFVMHGTEWLKDAEIKHFEKWSDIDPKDIYLNNPFLANDIFVDTFIACEKDIPKPVYDKLHNYGLIKRCSKEEAYIGLLFSQFHNPEIWINYANYTSLAELTRMGQIVFATYEKLIRDNLEIIKHDVKLSDFYNRFMK